MDFVFYKVIFVGLIIWLIGISPVMYLSVVSSSFSGGMNGIKKILIGLNGLLGSKMNSSLTLSNLLFSGIFLSILCANMWGLFPGLFGVSCQITVIIFLSLQMWLSIQVSSLSKGFISYNAHLTPAGAPGVLVPFLNIVELMSKLIRPLTLTLRLCMNMTTGHILLSLLNLSLSYSLVGGTMGALMLVGLILGYYLFELVICAIQASVYTLLVSQYLDEHTI